METLGLGTPMAGPELTDVLREKTRSAWDRFLDETVPFRPQLYAYCRKLTGSAWDAEDLVQDTLVKGFGTLGLVHRAIGNPRGYLVRIAANLWIDAQRRRMAEISAARDLSASDEAPASPRRDEAGTRNASAKLLEVLAPRESAAIVMKDVLDMSLKEIAEALSTTENAVKAALHRARGRLREESPVKRRAASAALVESFVACLNRSDLPGMLALMLDTASIEMPGADFEAGRDEFGREGSFLWQAVHVHPDMPKEMRPPKWVNRRAEFLGEQVMLSLMPESHGSTLQAVMRFEEEDGKIASLRSYCFSPELIEEIARALSLQRGGILYRFPMPSH
jgi:RNA polymerase sigma-70 factor (ECF subfamily)